MRSHRNWRGQAGSVVPFSITVLPPAEQSKKACLTREPAQSILADLKPEAVYFTDNNGQRAGFIFLEMQDASQIPAIAEPWFLAFTKASRFIRS